MMQLSLLVLIQQPNPAALDSTINLLTKMLNSYGDKELPCRTQLLTAKD